MELTESNKELLHEVLLQSMLKFPGRIAFETIETNKSITFAELFRRIECLAGALADLGVKKGDRVSILAENCEDYIGYHYATPCWRRSIRSALFALRKMAVIDNDRLKSLDKDWNRYRKKTGLNAYGNKDKS